MYRDCLVSPMYALKDGGDCLGMDIYPVVWRSQGMAECGWLRRATPTGQMSFHYS